MHSFDNIRHPAHYEVYPVQPIQITRHLGFCLGNAVKYVLRAPYKGGVEDCDKALQYLHWVGEGAQEPLSISGYHSFYKQTTRLIEFLANANGDMLWDDIASATIGFLQNLKDFLFCWQLQNVLPMQQDVRDISRILSLRDTIGQIYEGMSGLPQKEADNGHN